MNYAKFPHHFPVAVKRVQEQCGYSIWLKFMDGVEGRVDLSDLVLNHRYFAPLQDPSAGEPYLNEDGCVQWTGLDGSVYDSMDSAYHECLGLDTILLHDTHDREFCDRMIREAKERLGYDNRI